MIKNTAPYNQNIYPRGGIEQLSVAGYAHLDFSGGEVYEINIGADATAVLNGGKINRLKTTQWAWKWTGGPRPGEGPGEWVPNPHIEIICREWDYDTGTKKLTGTWNVDANKNGLFDLFNIQLIDVGHGYSPTIENIKFTIIPEPVTVVLLAAGGVLLAAGGVLLRRRV